MVYYIFVKFAMLKPNVNETSTLAPKEYAKKLINALKAVDGYVEINFYKLLKNE